MESIIEQLYDGKIYPAEQNLTTDPKYMEKRRQFYELEAELVRSLTEPQREQLEALLTVQLEMCGFETQGMFVRGYRLATQLLVEALKQDEKK